MAQTEITGVSGSLRDGSYTRLAVSAALGAAEKGGAETNHADLRGYDLTVFDPDDENVGAD